MAMTSAVKDELSRLEVSKTCCRKAELASLLRFAGGLHIIGGKIVVEAELDAANTARRVRRELMELYNHRCEVLVLAASGLRRGSRYVVRIVEGGEAPREPNRPHRRVGVPCVACPEGCWRIDV